MEESQERSRKGRKSGLAALPKVELHRHLDGSVRFETIVDLAKKNDLDLGVKSEDELARKVKILRPMKNLQEVLDSFWTTQKVLCNYDAIKRVAFENVEDAFQDGVRLLELRFATAFIKKGKEDSLQNDEIIEGIVDGIAMGMEKYPEMAATGLIHILPRSLSIDENKKAAKDILKYRKGRHPFADRLCGFDLADAEAGTDPMPYVPMVEEARQAGMGITIHSGEDTDHLCMERTIKLYHPSRIGHGIKSWGHESTLALIFDRNIHLEVCPTSNYLTQCVPSVESHPFPLLYKHGVSVSLNTDDPHLMGIDLVHEYELAQRVYGMTMEDFVLINKDALEQSFLDEDLKTYAVKKFFLR